MKKSAAGLILLIIISSCSNTKNGFSKSAKKFYESFFISGETMQYFIKPLEFDSNNSYLILDMTFRHKPAENDSSIINISFFEDSFIKKINSISISNTVTNIPIHSISVMFTETQKKDFLTRFKSKSSTGEIKKIFENSSWKIVVNENGNIKEYLPTKKTIEIIERLNHEIFISSSN